MVVGELGAAAALDGSVHGGPSLFGLTRDGPSDGAADADGAPAMWAGCGVLRGLGFALVVVAAAAVVANGADRRSRGGTLGWFGLVAGIPADRRAAPRGAADRGGGAGGRDARRRRRGRVRHPVRLRAARRRLLRDAAREGCAPCSGGRRRRRQAAALALGAAASGTLIAYAPSRWRRTDPALAGTLLLAASVTATIARLPAGSLGDRIGPHG